MELNRKSSGLWYFLKGFFVPLVPPILGLLFVPDTSGGAKDLIFLLMITPLVAIGILIYEYINNRRVMMYGTLVMLSMMILFLVWLSNGIGNFGFGYGY
ncbi:MAG: hypothetical protein CMB47_04100 [Euryarchaeota archaeon]|nr:hypothetical protein [Euryarchaeota archaeon]